MDEKKKSSSVTELSFKKDEKRSAALIAALSLAFNLCVFSPLDLYLNNISDIAIPYTTLLLACVPVGIVLFIVSYLLLRLTKGKTFLISLSVIIGLNAAMQIQGNILTFGMGTLDGTAYTVSPIRAILDLLLWAFAIALPLLLFKFAKGAFKKFIVIVPLAIIIIEVSAIISTVIIMNTSGDFIMELMFPNDDYLAACNVDNEFTFSKTDNQIVFIVDQYDSFIFDNAVSQAPDSVSGFDGFTYYNNTIGMYEYTDPSVAYFLTNKMQDEAPTLEGLYEGDTVFDHIPEEYSVEIYCDSCMMLPISVCNGKADNFETQTLSVEKIANISSAMYQMVLYRNAPDIAKGAFWMYSGDFTNKLLSFKTYLSENYLFYDSLPKSIEYTDSPCYKLYYLKGLHAQRLTGENMKRVPEGEASPTKCAIGVNKILASYLQLLKDGGVYDNSDIIILADHGHRPNYDAKYPLLMIKRKGDTFDGIKASSVPASYADLFATSCYLLGDTSMESSSVFALKEGEKRERYFAGTDEYITEDVDRSLPLCEDTTGGN